MKLSFVLTKLSGGRWWSAECPEIPGALSQGRTEKSAINNLKSAIRTLFAAARDQERKHEKQFPPMT